VAGEAGVGGAAVRGWWISILLLAALPAPARAQQYGLPPGPGWAGAGAAALIDPLAPPAASLSDPSQVAVWLAAARPWGVSGLHQEEGALAVPLGGRTAGALWWRQVSGDGIGRAHGAFRFSAEVGSGVRGSLTCGVHLLSSPGGGNLLDPAWSAGVVVVRSQLTLGVRGSWPARGRFTRGDLAWAAGVRGNHCWLRVAGRRERGRVEESGIVLALRTGGMRLEVGGWGRPLQPVGGLILSIGRVTSSLEGRWSPGLGALLLFGIRLGGSVRP
jgi:hypothetical protein